ncbi:MAG: sigma-70 family RNA polymerase sigma factor [Acidobacteria bacterium]|nr:sigma-70 family RNA polymerase sigma factor [Acidobacteriota bacterium]MDA1236948.1 sigma-70 family RNA polymerase sigma factor [Acidobacteriota bacterium]
MEENISALLQKVNAGDKSAEDELLTGLYRELRRLAAGCLRGDRRDHTLQPTALVNEAYVKMLGSQKVSWQNRAHFFGVAARVMRQILIDYARARMTEKRGGGVDFLQLDEALVFNKGRPSELLALDDALARLESEVPRSYKIVELRFFGGLSIEATAEVMGLSARTVRREWSFGRAWLRTELAAEAH